MCTGCHEGCGYVYRLSWGMWVCVQAAMRGVGMCTGCHEGCGYVYRLS
jgi:hypothetical protein